MQQFASIRAPSLSTLLSLHTTDCRRIHQYSPNLSSLRGASPTRRGNPLLASAEVIACTEFTAVDCFTAFAMTKSVWPASMRVADILVKNPPSSLRGALPTRRGNPPLASAEEPASPESAAVDCFTAFAMTKSVWPATMRVADILAKNPPSSLRGASQRRRGNPPLASAEEPAGTEFTTVDCFTSFAMTLNG